MSTNSSTANQAAAAAPVRAAPLEVQELTEPAFQVWKHHPVTKAVRRYLEDYRVQLLEDHLSRWANHQEFKDGTEEAIRARATAVAEFLNLSHEDISRFYGGLEDSGAS